ncbi:MAG: pollen Ole e 1 allergen/extensin family protein [Pirellulaceae bacterium]|nr:pollen Ole e 1 allergen/extensin family protein [Pirellulaceae bacterium]
MDLYKKSPALFLSFAFSLTLLMGCGSSGPTEPITPVTGTVTLDGSPLAGVRVSFMSVVDEKTVDISHTAAGTTDESGAFTLSTTYSSKKHGGAVHGEHVVIVRVPSSYKGDNPPEIPAKYGNAEKSPLRFTVTDDEAANNFKIELTSGG